LISRKAENALPKIKKNTAMGTFDTIFAILLIGSVILEVLFDTTHQLGHYEKRDSILNIKIAAIGIVVNFIAKTIMFAGFILLTPYALFTPGNGFVAMVVLFLLTDLQYYIFHWLCHRSRFFWAMHVIHHSSPRYNFSTAIRTPFTNSFFRFASFTPIVLLGFDPLMVIFMNAIIAAITFYQHTELVGKLGILEYIFITPSHHRVHHGSNKQYIDKNYGGVLLLWDKLFNTFEPEQERPVYGLTKPLTDTRLSHVLFHEWKDIVADIKSTSNWKHKVNYLFAPPGWKPSTSLLHTLAENKTTSSELTHTIPESKMQLDKMLHSSNNITT